VIVVINGQDRELPAGATVREAVELVAGDTAPDGRGLAVAIDGEVVPRGRWEQATLQPGARVEILAAIQGG
jgi:sulfur carrier protein